MSKGRLPFWLPAQNYYLLVLVFAGAVFLSVAAALNDGRDETPWITAGVSAAVFVVTLFAFRELVLRRFRRRALAAQRLSRHLRLMAPMRREEDGRRKITLEENHEMLREIRVKSDAAKVLGTLAEAHREVFDLCENYLTQSSTQISSARPGSPRIPAMRKGAKFAAGRHRFHMLKWAEVKARSFTDGVAGSGELDEKIGVAREALGAVDRVISVYPDEIALVDSRTVLQTFLVSAKIRLSVEKAEWATEQGKWEEAVEHYRTALSDLQQCDVDFSDREAIQQRINKEIGRISR